MQIIAYEPNEVWALFEDNRSEKLLTTMIRIAENPEFDIEICLSGKASQQGILPHIVVLMENEEYYSESAVDEKDCERTVTKIYHNYLDSSYIINNMLENGKDDEISGAVYDLIDETESTNLDLTQGYVEDLIGAPIEQFVDGKEVEQMLEDLLNRVCEYLYLEWGISVWRPMVLEDDKGDFFSEYPYADMIFDDDCGFSNK
jgi:hypothetical protein